MEKIIFIPNKETFLNFLYKRLNTIDIEKQIIKKDIESEIFFNSIYNRFKYNNKFKLLNQDKIKIITGHYCQFFFIIYELGRYFLDKNQDYVNKLYFLNVTQLSFDLPIELDLPLKTFIEHPLGTILSRHTKINKESKLLINSNCVIGGNINKNEKLDYPIINGNLIMLNNSSLIGNTIIKKNVILSNGSYVKDEGVLENVLVFGSSPNIIKKSIPKKVYNYYFIKIFKV